MLNSRWEETTDTTHCQVGLHSQIINWPRMQNYIGSKVATESMFGWCDCVLANEVCADVI